jgi:hypothetical protein
MYQKSADVLWQTDERSTNTAKMSGSELVVRIPTSHTYINRLLYVLNANIPSFRQQQLVTARLSPLPSRGLLKHYSDLLLLLPMRASGLTHLFWQNLGLTKISR